MLNKPEKAKKLAKEIIEKEESRGHSWAILAIEASLRGEVDEALELATMGLKKSKKTSIIVAKLLEDLIESLKGLKN